MDDSAQRLTIRRVTVAIVLCGAVGLPSIFLFGRPQGLFEKDYADALGGSAIDPVRRLQQRRAKISLPELEQAAVDVFESVDGERIERHLLNLVTPDRLSAGPWQTTGPDDKVKSVLEACYDPPASPGNADPHVRRDDAPLTALARLPGILRRSGVAFSRYTGYDGERQARDYIRGELNRLRLEIVEHPVDVPTPIDYGARLMTQGDGETATLELRCMMPNGARTSSLPTEGVSGTLIDGGNGSMHALKGKTIEGNIVVVDLDCRTRWENVFRLGGRAVIFRAPPGQPTNRDDAKLTHLFAAANYPRFYVSHAAAVEPLYGRQVRLLATMRWERREATTLIARAPGRDPEAGAIMITAHYDSSSVVPAEAPGADQACSAA